MASPVRDGIVRVRRREDRAEHGQAVERSRTKRERVRTRHGSATRVDEKLNGLPMLRTSERSTFRRCHWLWWQSFVERRKPVVASPPLRFGSYVHLALADYYRPGLRRGPHPAKTFAKVYEEEAVRLNKEFGVKVEDLEYEEGQRWEDAGTLGEAMLNAYVERYGKDDEWEVLVTEQAFKILVHKPTVLGVWPYTASKEPWFWYTGILDGIWRSRRTKKLHIVDHKTAKAIQLIYLAMDGQATGYWTWGLDWIYEKGLLRPDERPAGMLYNHLRKAMPDSRPYEIVGTKKVYLNKPTKKELKDNGPDFRGSYSKRQPPPYFVRTPIYRDWNEREGARQQVLYEFLDMERIKQASLERGSFYTDEPLSVGEPPPEAYKNQGQWTCPGCPAFDYCELHEVGADWLEARAMMTTAWDPYEAHIIYSDETK